MPGPGPDEAPAVPDAEAAKLGRRASDRDATASKRTLQALSRRLEALASSWTATEHVTLVGLFQLPEYFRQSRDTYEQLAATDEATVVAGYVGSRDPDSGVDLLELGPDSRLGDFWTVLVLTRRGCAGLRAQDTGHIGPGLSVEGARLFSTRTSTDPGTVAGWLRELLDEEPGIPRRERLQRAADEAGADADDGHRVLARALRTAWSGMSARIEDLQRTELLMFTDPLTGALNRRFLDHYLDRLGGRAPDIAVVAFDFDDFKSINDVHGHAVGDEALQLFAHVVRDHVRDTDVLARTGGDEWVLLLPGIELAAARDRVTRLIADAEARPLSVPGVHVRASAGIGVFGPTAIDLDAVDEALYGAKESDARVVVVTP